MRRRSASFRWALWAVLFALLTSISPAPAFAVSPSPGEKSPGLLADLWRALSSLVPGLQGVAETSVQETNPGTADPGRGHGLDPDGSNSDSGHGFDPNG